jgi:hypothetical protein
MKTKIKLIVLSICLVLSSIFVISSEVNAAGFGPTAIRVTVSPTSPTTSQAATVSIYSYYYQCSDSIHSSEDPNYCAANGYGTASEQPLPNVSSLLVTVSGSNNVISNINPTTDATGHGSFTLSSSTAETKTIMINWDTNPTPSGLIASATITVTVPVIASAQSSTSATKKTTAAGSTTSATSATTAPAVLKAESITVAGKIVNSSKTITIKQNDALVLSGKTVPNGIIKLIIHSTPRTATTTADAEGDWNYTIKNLETGNHYIEAAVTDPSNSLSSPSVKLLAFNVGTATPTKAQLTKSTKAGSAIVAIIAILVALLAITVVGAWYWWHRKKNNPAGTTSL